MNIKTITCHRAYNYGASLQAYALQHYVENLGHHVEIIDFWPYFFRGRYNLLFVDRKSKYYNICQRFPFLKLFYGILVNRYMLKTIGRKKQFDSFESSYLHITKQHYESSESLKQNPPKADVYIAGSDQIWNPDMPNGYEDAYYLDFGDEKVRRITYAASFGIDSIPEEHKTYVFEKCSRINTISVREESGVDILKDCKINNVTHVLDPVFLLSKQQWLQIADTAIDYNLPKNKYILLYEFIGDERVKHIALDCASKLGYKIVSVNDFIKQDYADININNAGPCEFISLISNAALVITNSFHATAFSIILNKDFYSYSLSSQKTSGRMAGICNLLGIPDRFNNDHPACTNIDYIRVEEILLPQQSKSQNYLRMSI